MKRTILLLAVCVCCQLLSAQRVLYIGDSVTDGGWGRSGGSDLPTERRNHGDLNHLYGHSYMMLCAAHYQSCQPYAQLDFLNRGISGNTLSDMEARWRQDVLALQPDVLSVLIGTNDVGKWLKDNSSDENIDYQGWEDRYRALLLSAKEGNNHIKLVLGTPFASKTTSSLRQRMTEKLSIIVRKIAQEEHAVCIPYDSLFNRLQRKQPHDRYWLWDGIHPTDLFLPEYASFYGPPQQPTTQSGMGPKAMPAAVRGATEAVINEAAEEGRQPQSDAFLAEWQLRTMEIIDKYQPDLLYFDNGINYRSLDPWKLRIARYYYNSAHQWGREVSIQSKSQAYLAGSIIDFERESRAPRHPYGRYRQVDDPVVGFRID